MLPLEDAAAPAPEVIAAAVAPEPNDGPLRFESPPEPPRDVDGDDLFSDLDDSFTRPLHGVLLQVVGIKFRDAGTIHPYDAGDITYRRGERVVVDSERGPILASVAIASHRRLADQPLRRILRRAGDEEERQRERVERHEEEAFAICRERVRALRLPLKVVRAELPLQGTRFTFYFASEERVDLRDLGKDLSQRLRGRVDLRQVGARDEAKMVGGIGDCGRELCCSTFLPNFAPVSIKMAKDQGLVLNPTRITGQCGRLKCCLVYEHALYQEQRQGLPKIGKRVTSPGGEGRVIEIDVLRRQVRVGFPEGGSQTFPSDTVATVALPGQPPRAASDE